MSAIQTSFGEQCIYYYLLPYNAKNRFKVDNMEIDIYLPDFNMNVEPDKTMPVGIEFNGNYWHRNRKEKDLIKELKLSHKVTMYYVCESDKNEIKGNKIFFNKEKYNLNLEWAIKTLFNILNLNLDVNIERDKQLIYKNSVKEEKENSLAFKFPELLKEWDYKRNLISPEQITPGSSKKVYWKCSNNHSYEMPINKRTTSNQNCPYCANKKVLKDYNDLLSNFPEICKEWDYEKNIIKPDEIIFSSYERAYWKCSKGHSYYTMIQYRTGKDKSGCPYCSNHKVLKGYNDLLTLNPEICKEWDYDKNIEKPDEVTIGSKKQIWWKCSNNHSYEAPIGSRAIKKSGCPYCSGRLVIKGKNDLLSNFPDICKEWDYEKNFNEYGLKPDEISKFSHKKVYWKCNNHHSFQTIIYKRTQANHGCPFCSNQKVLKGYNDLLSNFPDICKAWDYGKNVIKPDEITSGSNKKVWWKCKNNHSYKSAVANKTNQTRGCPYCSNHKILKGYNDLLTLYPELCKEWDYNKNKDDPSNILGAPSKKVWWKCSNNHSYEAYINLRVSQNSGCPYCSSKKVLKGFNDLQTAFPNILTFWDYEKNVIKPNEVTLGSNKKVYWKCNKDHSFLSSIRSITRTKNFNCQICKKIET